MIHRIFVSIIIGLIMVGSYLIVTGGIISTDPAPGTAVVDSSSFDFEWEEVPPPPSPGKQVELDKLQQQQEIQNSIQEKIREHTNSNLENRLLAIRRRYQQAVSRKRDLLEQELQDYINTRKQEFKEKVLVEQERLTGELKRENEQLTEEYYSDLQEYIWSLNKQYNNRLLNLQIKLEVVDLSPEEQEQTRQQIRQLENEKSQMIRGKKMALEAEFREQMERIQKEHDRQLLEYRRGLETELNQQIEQKQQQLDNQLNEYRQTQEQEMKGVLQDKYEELQGRRQQILGYQRGIIKALERTE